MPCCRPAKPRSSTIASRFAQKEGRFWNSGAADPRLERVREIAFPALGARHHSASILHRNGTGQRRRKHAVNFWIGEDTAMIGMSWGVEWCVDGFDRDWSYNPRCKMARP